MYATDPDESIVPIFSKAKYTDTLHQIGTGIFCEFEGILFLITAAHVTDNLENGELLVPTNIGIAAIEGYVAYIDLPPEIRRQDDEVDIAYFRISTRFARNLAAVFKPLSNSRSMLIGTALDLEICSICGFPVSRAKKKQGRYTSESAAYRGVAAREETYEKLGLSPELNIIIHFHKKFTVRPADGQKTNPIGPRGVSGGGIFSWPEGQGLSNDWSLPKLVGIFHTYKESDGLMIGTNLLSIISAIQLGKIKNFGDVD